MTASSLPSRDACPDDVARHEFVRLLGATATACGWLVLAYGLLSTHYHLLVQTPEPNLGDGMRWLNGRHAQILNAHQGTRGPLWRDRFHNTLVETESHVVHAAAYIDANPVVAGICSHPAHWPWSSYRANTGLGRPSPWHRVDLLHAFLAADRAEAPSVYAGCVATAIERARERSHAP